MERLIHKYAAKLVAARMADPGGPLLAGMDDEVVWNREDPARDTLLEVMASLNINSMLHCRPAEPYGSIVEHLAKTSGAAIEPGDTETRTFLHDLPVAPVLEARELAGRLKRRKSVISPGGFVTTFGTVSPEEAFIVFSSVCFACYVKFLSDCLAAVRERELTDAERGLILAVGDQLSPLPADPTAGLLAGSISGEAEVHEEMARVGKLVVEHELVDSYFGNISYLLDGILHISQTGSSMDELEGFIDPCPLDGTSSAGITASSELTAHLGIIERTGARAILHGHPRFSVAMSLDCEVPDCPGRGRCHLECSRDRFVGDVPIVPGEVGTGKYGLCNQVPQALFGRRGVIVYGHGVFTAGKDDFTDAVTGLFDIERMCREEFFRRI